MARKWIDLRLVPANGNQGTLVETFVLPLIKKVEEEGISFDTFHFLHEPEGLLFRIAAEEEILETQVRPAVERGIRKIAESLQDVYEMKDKTGQEYTGEAVTYGERGWEILEKHLECSSRIALEIVKQAPEEFSDRYVERLVHLLLNPLGLSLTDEIRLNFLGVSQRLSVVLNMLHERIGRLESGQD